MYNDNNYNLLKKFKGIDKYKIANLEIFNYNNQYIGFNHALLSKVKNLGIKQKRG